MSKKKELENEGTAYPMDNIPIRVRKVKEVLERLIAWIIFLKNKKSKRSTRGLAFRQRNFRKAY